MSSLILCSLLSNPLAATHQPVYDLYSPQQNLTIIRSKPEFLELIKEQDPHGHPLMLPMGEQRIKIVQFYMDTCPYSKKFVPYFLRFIKDVNNFWKSYIDISVVNCNERSNRNLCHDENNHLLVPLIRWYMLPRIAGLKHSKGLQVPESEHHRSFIQHERRDLISLRRATLEYISIILRKLYAYENEKSCSTKPGSRDDREWLAFYNELPLKWHLLMPLDRLIPPYIPESQENDNFMSELKKRIRLCLAETSPIKFIHNIFVFDVRPNDRNKGPPVAMTTMADWSNWACSCDHDAPYLIHYTHSTSLLPKPYRVHKNSSAERPLLFHAKIAIDQIANLNTVDQLNLEYLASKTVSQNSRQKVNQFGKSRSQTGDDNWTPESVYPGEEALRYRFNQAIRSKLFPNDISFKIAGFAKGHQGEIHAPAPYMRRG